MKCHEILAALSDYVDGELDPGLRGALEKHLADCNPCHLVVDTLRQTITVYKSGRPLELPPELRQRLGRALRERWEMEFPPRGSDHG
jgi:anti-sigma factor RsiW